LKGILHKTDRRPPPLLELLLGKLKKTNVQEPSIAAVRMLGWMSGDTLRDRTRTGAFVRSRRWLKSG